MRLSPHTTESRIPAFSIQRRAAPSWMDPLGGRAVRSTARGANNSLGAGALLLALASMCMLAWAPAHAQDAAHASDPKNASVATPHTPAEPAAAEPQGLSGMPGATDDSGWLAMLLVGGIVAATILNRQGR